MKATALKGLQWGVAQPGPIELMAWKSFPELELYFLVFSLGILDLPWQPMPMEFGSRMLHCSHLSKCYLGGRPEALSGLLQGARLPLTTTSSPPEHCWGALPTLNLNPPGCPSPVGPGLGVIKKCDASDPQTAPASCQEAPPTYPSVTPDLSMESSAQPLSERSWYQVGFNLSSTIYFF